MLKKLFLMSLLQVFIFLPLLNNYSLAANTFKKEYISVSDIKSFLQYADKNKDNWILIHKNGVSLFNEKYISEPALELLKNFKVNQKKTLSKYTEYVLYKGSKEAGHRMYLTYDFKITVLEINGKFRVSAISRPLLNDFVKINNMLGIRETSRYIGEYEGSEGSTVNVLATVEDQGNSDLRHSSAKRVECSNVDVTQEIIKYLIKYKKDTIGVDGKAGHFSRSDSRLSWYLSGVPFNSVKKFYPTSCAIIKTIDKEIKLNYYRALQDRDEYPESYEVTSIGLLLLFQGGEMYNEDTKLLLALVSQGSISDGALTYQTLGIGDYNNDGYHDIGIIENIYGGTSSHAIQISDDGIEIVGIGSVGWD